MNPANRLLVAAIFALSALAPAHAQVPSILNYQGRVTVGGTNLTTNAAQFKFALVNGDGTATFWRNDGSTAIGEPAAAVSVAVSQGLYSVLLGDTALANMAALPSSVFGNANVNLRVWFSPGGTNDFVQLSPDQRIGSSGYALRAAVADTATVTNVTGDLFVSGMISAAGIVGGQSNAATGSFSFVGGGSDNLADGEKATVAGGENNAASSIHATVAGGLNNFNGGSAASIGGGTANTIDTGAANSVISGGVSNAIGPTAINAFIGGGSFNYIESGENATIAGGNFNKVRGIGATVPGGSVNEAFGEDTFAAGVQAKATNVGSFVWSGTYGTDTVSTNDYSFTVRAPGGVRFITTTNSDGLDILASGGLNGVAVAPGGTAWATLSDRNAKKEVKDVDPRAVLAKLGRLPVTEWEYKHDPQRRYFGPMAQDFHAAFGLGADDKTINTLDADGVLFLSVKGLLEELKERDKVIQELKTKLETVEERLDSLPPAP